MKRYVKNKYMYAFILFLVVFVYALYDVIIGTKVENSHDIKTSVSFEIIPDDELIKDYESYKKFLKKYLSAGEYKEELSSNAITFESFNNNDYVAVFYESRACDNSGSLDKLTKLKNRLLLYVSRYEDENCPISNRILFVPVDKGYYDFVPSVIIKKEIWTK